MRRTTEQLWYGTQTNPLTGQSLHLPGRSDSTRDVYDRISSLAPARQLKTLGEAHRVTTSSERTNSQPHGPHIARDLALSEASPAADPKECWPGHIRASGRPRTPSGAGPKDQPHSQSKVCQRGSRGRATPSLPLSSRPAPSDACRSTSAGRTPLGAPYARPPARTRWTEGCRARRRSRRAARRMPPSDRAPPR